MEKKRMYVRFKNFVIEELSYGATGSILFG
jgi:hypothetical protein